MRCFIAINLPKEIKDYIYSFIEKFQKSLRKENVKVKWVSKKNLHVTLKFLGDVNEGGLEEIKKRLSKIKIESFELKLDQIGFFPKTGFIRVIYVGLEMNAYIRKLHNSIDSELLDLFPEEQDFSLHISLGRAKFVKDIDEFIKLVKIPVEDRIFEVKSFELMKSFLTKEGAKHSSIESYQIKNKRS